MDAKSADRDLLEEIESIDVSNLDGRKSSSPEKPHIILYAMDGTQIKWGARWDKFARYLEAPDREKLASLYKVYTQYGTIQGHYKFIELRIPQKSIPRPGAK